jgi:sialate O-acetylesterase
MEIKNGSAVISLTDAPNGFTSWDKEIEGFEIAGSNKSFYPAEAKIVGTTIQVQSDKVPTPVSVRYGFKDWAPGNLYSTEGLPVAPFRTDDW